MSPRQPLDIETRAQARFSAAQRHAILLRQSTDGIARCDGCDEIVATLSADGVWEPTRPHEFDHEKPRALGGRTHEENGRALCVPCHRSKSNLDVAMIAKSDRMSGGEGSQWHRRKQRKAAGEKSLIPNRGFK